MSYVEKHVKVYLTLNTPQIGLCGTPPVYQSLTDHTWYKHKIVHILSKIVVTVIVFEC